MLGFDYMSNVDRALVVVRGQAGLVAQAAKLIVDSAVAGGRFFIHDPAGMISYEAAGRAAGLFMVKQLGAGDLPRQELAEDDIILYFSETGGLENGERLFLDKVRASGAKVIGIVPGREPGGGDKRNKGIGDYCVLVIATGVHDNQGTLVVPGFAQRLGPIDVVVNCVVVWAVCAEAVGEFRRRGLTPSVYMSMRALAGKEHNSRTWARFQKQGF